MSPIANLEIAPASGLELEPAPSAKNGLASLLLTVVELIRQLMEAQVIRRMDAGLLSEVDLDRAADSFRKLEEQVIHLCDIFEIDPDRKSVV